MATKKAELEQEKKMEIKINRGGRALWTAANKGQLCPATGLRPDGAQRQSGRRP